MMRRNTWSSLYHVVKPFTGAENVPHPSKTSSKKQLLFNVGILFPGGSSGLFHVLPLGQRIIDKIIKIIDDEFRRINAQKVTLSSLIQTDLWETSGRLGNNLNEIFHVTDRNGKKFILNPTNEESITSFVGNARITHNQLPLKFYQTTMKYRDEDCPRLGLVRSREFLMTDLYSFDSSKENSRKTYDDVRGCFRSIFQRIGFPFYEVLADSGDIGGDLSHEFVILSNSNVDKVLICETCKVGTSLKSSLVNEVAKCESCGRQYDQRTGVEIAHTFLLGNKYSKSLDACYLNSEQKYVEFEMGSFGIGITRLLGALVDLLSVDDQVRLPSSISPFLLNFIPSKYFSVDAANDHLSDLFDRLNDDLIIDDRFQKTLGARVHDAKNVGIPFIVVAGKPSMQPVPSFEFIDVVKDETCFMNRAELLEYFSQFRV